jgi:SPX domain protein involved in polyphosphate accumulation
LIDLKQYFLDNIMLFEKYLEDNMYIEWKDYYINYSYLKNIIENIINKKPNSEKIFVKELEKSWIKYYNFASQLIDSALESDLNKNKLVDIFKINEFININQEGFRKIIKKHDKNSNYSLYPAWKWKIKSNTFEKLFPTIKKNIQIISQG